MLVMDKEIVDAGTKALPELHNGSLVMQLYGTFCCASCGMKLDCTYGPDVTHCCCCMN